jgi:hypothetical protein
MKRITAKQKAMVEAHLKANESGVWDFPYTSNELKTTEDIKKAIEDGKTVQRLHQEISFRFCNTTANILQSMFKHQSQSYVRDYTNGFKQLFANLNIDI